MFSDQPHSHPHPIGGGGSDGPGPFGWGGGRGRARRGEVRIAVLLLLAEGPMHGYQLMRAINDRTSGRWSPSPGAVYPTISQLEDEGIVSVTAEGGRRLVRLTDAGRAYVDEHRGSWTDPFGAGVPGPGDLRGLLAQLVGATREVGRFGDETQVAEAAEVLRRARRRLYRLLADDDDAESSRSEG
jgi:DNA-binding PadR family transcriptional regulator